jgi:hypothetical protein
MLEKFKFWKHEEQELPPMQFEPTPTPSLQPMEPLGPSQDPNFQHMSSLTQRTSEKDLELIGAKLDVLKAQLDNIVQRLDHLERTLQENKEMPRVRW